MGDQVHITTVSICNHLLGKTGAFVIVNATVDADHAPDLMGKGHQVVSDDNDGHGLAEFFQQVVKVFLAGGVNVVARFIQK